MQTTYLDFEQGLSEIDKRLEALGRQEDCSAEERAEQTRLTEQQQAQEAEIYKALQPWQRIQL